MSKRTALKISSINQSSEKRKKKKVPKYFAPFKNGKGKTEDLSNKETENCCHALSLYLGGGKNSQDETRLKTGALSGFVTQPTTSDVRLRIVTVHRDRHTTRRCDVPTCSAGYKKYTHITFRASERFLSKQVHKRKRKDLKTSERLRVAWTWVTPAGRKSNCALSTSATPRKSKKGDGVGVREGSGKKNPFPARGVVPSTPPIRKLARKEHKEKEKKKKKKKNRSIGRGFPNFQISRVEEKEKKKKETKKKQCNSTRTSRGAKGLGFRWEYESSSDRRNSRKSTRRFSGWVTRTA
ncbi:hypothetical protein CEXT_755281 [Caerostris extrusa]|uniref:Uncharacterized protein n=1 Tax=Caerostris extrusa TaxID=172846 RepID=A0AAV4P748_CAEEX|nr:hypothetical protein CEXT_755281 [Caerostris extrusa]